MKYNLTFVIQGIYRTSSPIGLFEGFIYYNAFGRESVYYPKNKTLLRLSMIGKEFNVSIIDNILLEKF